jgi:hypothetical protein
MSKYLQVEKAEITKYTAQNGKLMLPNTIHGYSEKKLGVHA